MFIGIIGLGRMGGNMSRRLAKAGHTVVAFDRSADAVGALSGEGVAKGVASLAEMAAALPAPRVVWVMVPAGAPTEQTIAELLGVLHAGDVIIEGGNSNYKDSQRRAAEVHAKGLGYLDVGTSGGIWGLKEGYALMVGGEAAQVEKARPIFEALAPAPDRGWGHVGPSGAGHFTKMIHNGIEYGLMQAYAEGFELLSKKKEMGFDLPQIAELWRHGSVVRSWLLDLTADALAENPTLEGIAAYVPDSGEGRWTVMEAIELDCAIPVISESLFRRFRSRDAAPFGDKLLSAMRGQFGGHAVKKG
jgi:6-phosphogluconate dehydrogenase